MAATLQPDRELGSTGVHVPLVGYGTAPLGKKDVTRDHAIRCLEHALERGMTYIDTSPDYGSEPHVGELMRSHRDEVFLATKVNRRSRDGVLDELKESLRRLQTDHVDLVQVHSVSAFADLEQALAADGALAGLEQARREGLTRFIGITGHSRPAILGHALTQFSFDTVLCALSVVDRIVTSPETFLLPVALERRTGVIAMKVLGHGTIENREAALRYSLGLPGVSLAIVGLKDVDEIDAIVEQAARFRALDADELQSLIDEVRPLVEDDAEESQKSHAGLFWLRDTKITGWKEQDEPTLVAY